MTTLVTVDLDRIQEIYKKVKKNYSNYGEIILYFLATCLYLDLDLDFGNCNKIEIVWWIDLD